MEWGVSRTSREMAGKRWMSMMDSSVTFFQVTHDSSMPANGMLGGHRHSVALSAVECSFAVTFGSTPDSTRKAKKSYRKPCPSLPQPSDDTSPNFRKYST